MGALGRQPLVATAHLIAAPRRQSGTHAIRLFCSSRGRLGHRRLSRRDHLRVKMCERKPLALQTQPPVASPSAQGGHAPRVAPVSTDVLVRSVRGRAGRQWKHDQKADKK
jgi:hypothetical protein